MSQSNSESQLRENMIEALLQSAYQTDSQREQESIESVLQRIKCEVIDSQDHDLQQLHESADDLSSAPPAEPSNDRRPRRWNRWISWSLAASVLIVIGLAIQFVGESGNAIAAVERSLAAAKELVARHYRITVKKGNGPNDTRVVTSDLYVQGANQFALRHPALIPNRDVWLGSDGTDSWFLPAIGPVRVGDQTGLGKWLANREQLSTPILHLETILTRLKRGYDLKQEPDATMTLDDGTPVICQHVIGDLKSKGSTSAPEKIELWCDKQTGVAIRLDGIYGKPVNAWGRRKSSIVFVDSPKLSDEWFTPAGHHLGFRQTLSFDSDE